MELYYENDFKNLETPIIISRREATKNSLGCMINAHEYLEFYFIISGGVKVFCNGAAYSLSEGDIIFINWCQPHRSLEFLDNTLYYIVQFDLNTLTCGNYEIFQTKYVSKLINDMKFFKTHYQKDKKLINLFEILVSEYENPMFTCELTIQAAIYNILAYIINSANTKETEFNSSLNAAITEYSKKIIQYLYANYNQEINLEDISVFIGISSAYMCRAFKQYTGTTIIKYLNQIRCKKAISLIKEGHTMTDASILVGYNEYTYFSKAFKNIYGMSPKKLLK